MAYILSLETATKNCSVSISNSGEMIACKEFAGQGYEHAEKLHVFIQECLQMAGISFQELSAIAVSKGPGSYTGLRIGVSAAKGLCVALDKPLIALDTLQVLAKGLKIENGSIVPMIDARRMEVYTAAYSENLQEIIPVQALVLTESSFDSLEGDLYFVGDSNEKAKTVLQNERFHFIEDVIYPSSKEMASLAYEKFMAEKFENLTYFEPFYLKDFVMN